MVISLTNKKSSEFIYFMDKVRKPLVVYFCPFYKGHENIDAISPSASPKTNDINKVILSVVIPFSQYKEGIVIKQNLPSRSIAQYKLNKKQ